MPEKLPWLKRALRFQLLDPVKHYASFAFCAFTRLPELPAPTAEQASGLTNGEHDRPPNSLYPPVGLWERRVFPRLARCTRAYLSEHRRVAVLFFFGLVGLLLIGSPVLAVGFWPSLAAQNVDVLRDLIGDAWVAQLETAAFDLIDAVRQGGVHLNVVQPSAPWAEPADLVAQGPLSPGEPSASLISSPEPIVGDQRVALNQAPARIADTSSRLSVASHRVTLPSWEPSPLVPLGTLPGEGQWSAYLQDSSGQTVAYRTFLQPDPKRPYAVAAVVVFDLNATRLHFVLGSDEPKSEVKVARPGVIPADHLQPGLLLATFSGGFKARHGHYGVMVEDVVVLPPLDGIGTIAIYSDGHVSVGAWGTDILSSPDIVAWRQNGPLIVDGGRVNAHTSDDQASDWGGYVLSNLSPSWRSAAGLSPDGGSLYYVAGPSLTLPFLAQAVAHTGATEAIQLEVNNFWVHFAAIRSDGTMLVPEPLLEAMTEKPDRYLHSYPRDFFYVTAANVPGHD